MQLFAPAKINLSFEIKVRRADGFHEIETLMTPISLADRLTLEVTSSGDNGIEFSCDDPSLPTGEDNLVVRAAKLFREATKLTSGIKIVLEKKIPHGAGLGGGSSDAASTLLGLNELFGSGLTDDDLLKLAAQLGSDVPFFIVRSAAICRGRGEIVTPTSIPGDFNLLLLKPDFGVHTSWAYGKWKASQQLPGIDYSPQEFGGARFVNDLERPVFEKFVVLGQLKTWLRRQAEVGAALMSGSGSTVFAVLRDVGKLGQLSERIQAEIDPTMWMFECKTL
ncbi:MAG TPA: 4-(cytidine 5'-diphospho)-2-C-methyl-D-erythritol kinase [Chthoniobacterales bacterium]|nr:4-(cytidine 5'-diphospho)-2-C-methyl-D-erythritol kinase [Chthoniobacterales bacterium]